MQKLTLNNANVRISEDTLIFDTGELPHVILSIDPGITVKYALILLSDGVYNRHVDIATGSTFSGTAIIVTKKSELRITTQVRGDNVSSTLALLALATHRSDTGVEGVAKVDLPYRHVSTRVDQTNILLGSETRVRGVPRLEVATDDIEGGHSCKIHRLRGDAAFYLESRGLSSEHAESLLLNSEILKHLSPIQEEDERRKICYEIHKQLKNSSL